MTRFIYKILTNAQWDSFCAQKQFLGAPVDLADGYIHFSHAQQLAETLEKHFGDHEVLMIARCSPESFGPDGSTALKWEISRGGELFPHLYAPLSIDAVDRSWQISRQDGRFVLPDELTD